MPTSPAAPGALPPRTNAAIVSLTAIACRAREQPAPRAVPPVSERTIPSTAAAASSPAAPSSRHVPVPGVAVGGDQAVQREIAQRLPDHGVRRLPGAQQSLELVGGGDLEDAERSEDVGAQRGGRAVGIGGAAPVRGAARPGRRGRFDSVALAVVVVVRLGGALRGVHRLLPRVVVTGCLFGISRSPDSRQPRFLLTHHQALPGPRAVADPPYPRAAGTSRIRERESPPQAQNPNRPTDNYNSNNRESRMTGEEGCRNPVRGLIRALSCRFSRFRRARAGRGFGGGNGRGYGSAPVKLTGLTKVSVSFLDGPSRKLTGTLMVITAGQGRASKAGHQGWKGPDNGPVTGPVRRPVRTRDTLVAGVMQSL
ncbi:hypothetical protein GCM10010502_61880 [Kitasatospora aureofaciens]|uniref:Uncharacterized protein n=1 Tax=Kitasatospora aureofaciens TaxID=1894 RepID=A0A8H9HXQ1_KITAU|nr:hypothetical protein GCM10010502_61880 [Kitasatospora aureofaciens]